MGSRWLASPSIFVVDRGPARPVVFSEDGRGLARPIEFKFSRPPAPATIFENLSAQPCPAHDIRSKMLRTMGGVMLMSC